MFDIVNFLKNLLYNMLAIFSFSRKKLSNKLSIYVKSNTGSTLSVDLEPHMDIKDVKEIVAPQLGLAPDELKIIFAGKELSDTITISVSVLKKMGCVIKGNQKYFFFPSRNVTSASNRLSTRSRPGRQFLLLHRKTFKRTANAA